MPDTRGMMRVFACVYNQGKGWNPHEIIAVHTGRLGHFDKVAGYLQASKINVIDFSPKTFWKMMGRGSSVNDSLAMAMDEADGGAGFLHLNKLVLSENAGPSGMDVAECDITNSILPVLTNLTFDNLMASNEEEGIAKSLDTILPSALVNVLSFVALIFSLSTVSEQPHS